mmetsp:Transcript_3453/g.8312  ORF Transcript_3453/g.8312 Transcript_3453/m.8312 type:complete len:367 (+) Transcript_3453:299-1399(+)
MGSSGRPHAEQQLHYPTPKALFRDTPQPKEPLSQYRSSSPGASSYSTGAYSSQSAAPLSTSTPVGSAGMRLEDAARRGDMDRVARLAVEILRLAQQGDAQTVLDMVAPRSGGGGAGSSSVDRLTGGMKRLSVRDGQGTGEVKFSPYISAVHQKRDGITIEQVPTGLRDSYAPEPQGRKDALRLLAMTEPLMDSARPMQTEPMTFGVDVGVLKRTIISVAQQATRLTARESRVLEVSSPCYVLGDIHGNLVDLQFFRKTLWPAGPEVTAGDFLFLGDFVDRGKDSIPCVAYIMAMKVLNPHKWWMIRGNHETREVNGNTEHYQDGSFLNQCLVIFGESDGYAVWEAVNNFFDEQVGVVPPPVPTKVL